MTLFGSRPRSLLARTLGAAGVLLMSSAGAAGADPAGPTDYQTEIESVEPASTAFDVSIVGGDSFLLLKQIEPVEIDVPGYNNEPYLRYLIDGTVEENRRSPTTYLNTDRYGNATNSELPADASADAEPEWKVVATDGVYAWHDHRAHWMLADAPLGLGPGDQILDERIPITVDGDTVQLVVASYWQSAPSPLPALAGTVLALAVLIAVWRTPRRLWAGLLVGAVPAVVVGGAQFASLPSATEPSPVLWLLPLVGVIAALGAGVTRSRPATALPLIFGGAVALVVFGVTRVDGITKAILPTNLPFWVDRLGTTLALGVGVGVVILSAVELSRLLNPGSTAAGSGAASAA